MLMALSTALLIVAALLAVAVAALRRQIRAAKLTMLPLAAVPPSGSSELEKAPLVSAPSLGSGTLTIGGASRDARFVLLVFVEPGSPLSEDVTRAAIELCQAAGVRLLLIGEEGSLEPAPATDAGHVERILSGALRDDFRVGPGPSAALLDAQGYLVARGTVQHRQNLEALLSSFRTPEEPDPDDSPGLSR